ncbi:hypothetical protein U1Q18_038459 [Sarracenia purpurea var. burkii]
MAIHEEENKQRGNSRNGEPGGDSPLPWVTCSVRSRRCSPPENKVARDWLLRVNLVVEIRSRNAEGAAVTRRAMGSEIRVDACSGCEGSFLVVTRLWMECL